MTTERQAWKAKTREIRERFTAERKALGINQRELAARMGVNQSSISDLETRDVDPLVSTIYRWAAALGYNTHITFEYEEPEPE